MPDNVKFKYTLDTEPVVCPKCHRNFSDKSFWEGKVKAQGIGLFDGEAWCGVCASNAIVDNFKRPYTSDEYKRFMLSCQGVLTEGDYEELVRIWRCPQMKGYDFWVVYAPVIPVDLIQGSTYANAIIRGLAFYKAFWKREPNQFICDAVKASVYWAMFYRPDICKELMKRGQFGHYIEICLAVGMKASVNARDCMKHLLDYEKGRRN